MIEYKKDQKICTLLNDPHIKLLFKEHQKSPLEIETIKCKYLLKIECDSLPQLESICLYPRVCPYDMSLFKEEADELNELNELLEREIEGFSKSLKINEGEDFE